MRRVHRPRSIPAAIARAGVLTFVLFTCDGASAAPAPAPATGPVAISRAPSLALEQCAAVCQQAADAALAKCDGHLAYVPGRDAKPQAAPNCRANIASAYRSCATDCTSRFGS